ncbi:hypothetical protein BS17DRAFT_788473 [Gyrodon lividus]|nr:hypothetical protein BS17DRAFT_788473 [Gyrodon lividus]
MVQLQKIANPQPPRASRSTLRFLSSSTENERLACAGPNQHRMCSTTSVAFLTAAGITKFPVFGLLTEGCKGVVTCSWREVKKGYSVCFPRLICFYRLTLDHPRETALAGPPPGVQGSAGKFFAPTSGKRGEGYTMVMVNGSPER